MNDSKQNMERKQIYLCLAHISDETHELFQMAR